MGLREEPSRFPDTCPAVLSMLTKACGAIGTGSCEFPAPITPRVPLTLLELALISQAAAAPSP